MAITLLSQRLKELVRVGIVERRPAGRGAGVRSGRVEVAGPRQLREPELLGVEIRDAVIADSADMIARYGLDLETVRDVVAQDLFGGRVPAARPGTI
jgi:hypothetical protein